MSTQPRVEAVIFDWAGTIVDFGSMAPVAAFAAAFEDARVPVTVGEIRKYMGLEKRTHLTCMLRDDATAARWRQVYGHDPSDDDVDRLYNAFDRMLLEILQRHAEPIPGVLDVIARLRSRGVKIGSNSGYSLAQMHVLSRAAGERGFHPDCIVSASEVSAGRPAPDLSLVCLERLGVSAGCIAVKVDDTRSGIEEGRNAGLWTVAVAVCGNEVGLPIEDWSALETAERERLRQGAYERLRASNPDYIIDTVADLDDVIVDIEMRVKSREPVL